MVVTIEKYRGGLYLTDIRTDLMYPAAESQAKVVYKEPLIVEEP